MATAMIDAAMNDIDSAIFADEVGLAYAVYGEVRLGTAFQPIFRLQNQALVPFAVEARVAPRQDGVAILAGEFLAAVPDEDRAQLDAVCRTLHIRNHSNLGVDDPAGWPLYITVDARDGADLFAKAAWLASEADLVTSDIVCEIAGVETIGEMELKELATSARMAGFKLSIAAFRADRDAIEQVSRIEPDVIKIDGAWFRNVQDRLETASLFPAVITAFKGLGARLLVQGIETEAELTAALDAGADWLQGNFLAEAALAGTIVDESALSLAALAPAERREVHKRG